MIRSRTSLRSDAKVGAQSSLAIVVIAGLVCGIARAEDTHKAVTAEHLYQVSCSGCHGREGRGDGPVSPFLTVDVPDLTRIAARRGGVFPEEEIFRIVDGQADLRSHGPRHMPVWGYEFFGDDPDDEVAHRQALDLVKRLVEYLRSIQRAE
jgi:mono/diheme cytochrome c family protein